MNPVLELVLYYDANIQTRGRIAQCSHGCATWILQDKAWVTVRAHLIAAFPPWRSIFDGGAERRRRHRKARRVEPLSLKQMIQTYFAPFMDQEFPFDGLKKNREFHFPASFEMRDRELENVYGGLITLLAITGVERGVFVMVNMGYLIKLYSQSSDYYYLWSLHSYSGGVDIKALARIRLRRLLFP